MSLGMDTMTSPKSNNPLAPMFPQKSIIEKAAEKALRNKLPQFKEASKMQKK